MKLQDAYVSEVGVYYGGWNIIGYKMNNTANFTYSSAVDDDATVSIGTTTAKAWSAKNNAALNDCAKDSEWNIQVAGNVANGGAITYTTSYTAQANCSPLTPSFDKIGK